MGVLEMITAGFKAFSSLFDFVGRKTELNNTPEMIKNKNAQNEQKEKEKDVKAIQEAIKTDNLDELRKRIS